MAQYFEVSSEALIRRYVATGLLQDEARYFREQALATVEDALRGRLADPELVEAVIDDARAALARRANPRGRSPEKVAEIHSKAGRRVEGVELPFSSD